MKVTNDYVFFWQEYLSNWAIIPGGLTFELRGRKITVPTSEHVFMIYKANYFKDYDTVEKMIIAKNPKEVKHLGREVKGFDYKQWYNVSVSYMTKAVKLRFEQDDKFRTMLMSEEYKGKTFVEASPYDKLWGIGLDENNEDIHDKSKWQGENRLGKILTRIRNKALKGSSESLWLDDYLPNSTISNESVLNSVFKYFSEETVNNTVSKWIFKYVEKVEDTLAIEDIDPTNLDKELIQKFFDKEEDCLTLLDWVTVPNYDLLPQLREFGRYIDELYGFKRAIPVYRGIRSGLTFKHKQETMGLIDNTTFDNALKDYTKRGYQFEFNPTGPMSVARSPWIAKIYGNVISKCQLPPETDKLVITAELAYVLQRLQKEKYQDKRAINMSCMMEIVVFPGQPTQWEVVTTTGDISSELPSLMNFDDDNLAELEELISYEKLKEMPLFKLTKKDDELMSDKRYVRLLFMVKYVCKVEEYINPNSTFSELKITEKKYNELHNHIFKNYYLGDIQELPKYNASTKFKDFARWVIDNLKKIPKELIGTDPTQDKEDDKEETFSNEGLSFDKVYSFVKGLNILPKFKQVSFNELYTNSTNKYYVFDNFPYQLFTKRLLNKYKTSRLEHMVERVGHRQVRVHKFFIPELLYMLEQLEFPKSLINDIFNHTWVGDTAKDARQVNMSLISQNMKCDLYPHQKEFIEDYISLKVKNNLRGYLLSFEQGLGKTITSLALMEALGKEKVVIFCPKNTMRETWGAHITQFYKEPQNVYYAYDTDMSDPSKRFYILNYEAIDKLDPALFKSKNTGIIIDESHNFLRMSADRTSNLINFVKSVEASELDLLPMSGTPIKCAGVEMIPMFYILDPLFDDTALEIFKAAFGFNMKIATDVLHHRLSCMMSRVTKEILNLPKKNEMTIMVKTPDAQTYTVRSVQLMIQDFIKDREIYHQGMMNQYHKEFDSCVAYLKQDPMSDTREFQDWLLTVQELSEGRSVTMYPKGWIAKINQYEKDVIIPALPPELRKKFKASKAAVKYLYLKIRGEVLGGLLGRLRQQMTTEMVKAAHLENIVADAAKKTVIFTSYVDTIEIVEQFFKECGIQPMSIYGKTAKELTDNIKTFQNDPRVNPLIASLKMLSTGATLTAANTVIFLNKPWRSIEYDQASDRVHRIGQDTDVNIISLVLDTGSEGNLSTRMEEIMNYSSELFDGIVEGEDIISNEMFALLPQDTQAMLEYACEKLFIKDKNLLAAVNMARPVTSKEELQKQLKPGDLLIVYRSVKNPNYLVDSIFSPLAKRIQGSSFTSIKIVGRTTDTVYGFGVRTTGRDFDKMPMKAFLTTCPGVLVLRRPTPFREDELDRLYAWFEDRRKKIHYSVAKMWKSLVTHLGFGNKDKTTEETAQKFMKPMFCSTILAYGFKAAGINDGITVNRDTVWPKDYILNSAFRPIIRYFKKDEDAEAVLAPYEEKPDVQGMIAAKEVLYDVFGEDALDLEDSLEKLIINNKKLLEAMSKAKDCETPEDIMKMAQPGDLVLTYRKQQSFLGKTFAAISNRIQGSSFASIKIVDENPKYVLGFGAKMDTPSFAKVKFSSFLKTCNGVALLRLPGGIPEDKKREYFDYLHNRVKESSYDTMGIAKSLVSHLFGTNKDNSVSKEEAKSAKTMFCSTIFAYANKAVGINDGLTVDRKSVWPVNFVTDSNYKPVARYFVEKDDAEKIFGKAEQEQKDNGKISEETAKEIFEIQNVISNEVFGCDIMDLTKDQYDLLTESEEKLFIKSKALFDALSMGKPIKDRAELETMLRPGDLLLVYRTYQENFASKALNFVNSNLVQRTSFTSVKIVYKDPKYVVGFGARMKDKNFSKVTTRSFLETCNGVAVLRLPGGISGAQAEKLWKWIDERIDKLDYYVTGLLKSVISHWSPFAKNEDTTTEDQATGLKNNMFCSSVFAYAFKSAGINDGLNFNREAVWPIDFAIKSNFKCVYRYFAPGQGADQIFLDDKKDAEGTLTEGNEAFDIFDAANEKISLSISEPGEVVSIPSILNELNTPDNESSNENLTSVEASYEAMTDEVIKKKKASILNKICKVCDIIEPSGMNSNRYRQIIGNMSPKQFDEFVQKIKKGQWQLDLIVPNFEMNVTNDNLIKAADAIDCKLMHKIWMRDEATGKRYLTDNEYLVLTLPIRRQQQFIDEKMSVPDNDQKIDGLSGQVTGDDDSCSITNPEIQILAARGLDRTLEELVNVRGGNIQGYANFKQALEETGEASLTNISPDFKPRISVVAEVLMKAMMLDNNIAE